MNNIERLQKFTAIAEADKERTLKELTECYENGECSIKLQQILSQLVVTNCILMKQLMDLKTP